MYKNNKKLKRNIENSWIGGVCSGLSKYFDIDVSIIRFLFIMGTLFLCGSFILIYLILWIIIPEN